MTRDTSIVHPLGYKRIGIIGGMGPEATADLYVKITRYFQQTLGASSDSEFPECVIHSIPIPDVVRMPTDEDELLGILVSSALLLKDDGCEVLVIACNSVQYLLPQLREAVGIPMLSIADSALKHCQEHGINKVGLLSTVLTIQKRLYANTLNPQEIEVVVPNESEQCHITHAILKQMEGGVGTLEQEQVLHVARAMIEQGVQAVLLACTEMPLILNGVETTVPFVDCNALYARDVARFSTES